MDAQVLGSADEIQILDPVVASVMVEVVHLHLVRNVPSLQPPHPSVEQPSSTVRVVAALSLVPSDTVVYDELCR